MGDVAQILTFATCVTDFKCIEA